MKRQFKLAYRKNMKDQILTQDRSFALCLSCGSEYSANSGDYWDMKDTDAITCCDEICTLARKHTKYELVK